MQRRPTQPEDSGSKSTAAEANAKTFSTAVAAAARAARSSATDRIQTRIWVAVIVMTCLLTAIISISVNRAHGTQGREMGAHTAFGAGITEPVIDPAAIEKLRTVQTALTQSCTPDDAYLDSFGIDDTFLTKEDSQTIWDAITANLRPTNSTPNVGCLFFGSELAQLRTGLHITPVHYCHAFVNIALTWFQVAANRELPQDFANTLHDAVSIAYPLNMFWTRMCPSCPDADAALWPVVYNAHSILLLHDQETNQSINVRAISTEFCNPYFAKNALSLYDSALMPYLAFPFLGLLQRTGHTTFGNNIVEAIGRLNPFNFTAVQKLYIVGDVLDDDPSAALLVDAFFGTISIDVGDAGVDVTDRFAEIEAEITPDLNPPVLTGLPVAVLGRYAEDIVAYKSVMVNPRDVYVLLTNKDPDGLISDEISLDILSGAYSSQAISVLDTTTDHAYERVMGPDYKIEKDVAELLMLLASPTVWINMTTSSTLAGTYALGNTIIQGTDVSGNLQARVANRKRLDRGRASGFRELSFAAQLHTSYTTFEAADTATLPDNFFWTTKRPECVCRVKNQGICGNCWAMATADMLQSRMCIFGKTSKCEEISAQHVTSCAGDSEKDGCVGDHPNLAATFLATVGGLDDACFPYQNANKRTEVPCQTNCKAGAGKSETLYFSAISPPLKQITGALALKMELMRGPVEVGFSLPPDFDDYFDANPRGIYQMKPNNGGGHVVVLYGYDDRTMPPLWYCKNTWGEDFADNGFFRISQLANAAVGFDYMIIENHGYYITPYSVKTSTSHIVPEPNNNDPSVIVDDTADNVEQVERPPKPTKKPHVNSGAGALSPGGVTLLFFLVSLIVFHRQRH